MAFNLCFQERVRLRDYLRRAWHVGPLRPGQEADALRNSWSLELDRNSSCVSVRTFFGGVTMDQRVFKARIKKMVSA